MKAMIFAAGEGRRMHPLTLATPKPLLRVGGVSLLEHQIRRLKAVGTRQFVINVAYLADQIITELKDMDLTGLQCDVSVEEQPLETGGGLLRALPYLGREPFLLMNADVWSALDLKRLVSTKLKDSVLAHLVMVPNPTFHPEGDFALAPDGQVSDKSECLDVLAYTYSGISIIRPELIENFYAEEERFPLKAPLICAMKDGKVSGELYTGEWCDIGTPERLEDVRAAYVHVNHRPY